MARLQSHLQEFKRLSRPGPYEYEWVFHHDGGQHETHLVFGVMVHGNEIGSLPGALKVIEALRNGQLQFGGKATWFIGNPEAGLENKRFLESDLNRVFYASDTDNHEFRRARQIMPILDDCHVFIDFHQTILETRQPFYIFPWNHRGWLWARALQAAKVWVTRHPGQAFSTGTCCADEYVRIQDKPGLTVELSAKGFSDEAERIAIQTMVEALAIVDAEQTGEANLATLAEAKPDIAFFHTVHREPFASSELSLKPGLVNFMAVHTGAHLSLPNSPSLTAPTQGMLLFPKYPPRENGLAKTPMPKEIYRIIEPLPKHPSILYATKASP